MSSTEKNHTTKKAHKTTARKRAKKITKRATKRTTKRASKSPQKHAATKSTTKNQSRTITPEERGGSDSPTTFPPAFFLQHHFPFETKKITVYSARVGGFTLVLVGIFATYYFLEAEATELATAHVQSAQVMAAAKSDSSSISPVSFTYRYLEGNSLSQIAVSVSSAEEVHIYAYNTETGGIQFLGRAQKENSSKWVYTLNDNDLESGTYWMKAIVFTKEGAYDRSDDRIIDIH